MIPQSSELFAVSGTSVYLVVGWDEETHRPYLIQTGGYRVPAKATLPPEGALLEFCVTPLQADLAASARW
jgi:hypothetical protein